ncbi:TlyA family RNA methyltransferase [Propionibacterium sp. NM47_B9-13]|jgi:23S rRNA (cytidine1920-2'-O)/16S rRNA (cytidine1409-2'-O)-methyltransferase|nr:TlyA family RNA methyltransferase [Cutibacterium modestum]REB74553.1 TlyA family RNA methyltransferase [Cutibacterium modestum]TGY27280.1 TlyA family RNA methyltransferase [Propionibacterium sp. NM47_B9-13]
MCWPVSPRLWVHDERQRWQSVHVRLDQALVEAGLARSRTLATRLVREGRVTVNGIVVTKPAMKVSASDNLVADEEVWVSRAAYKLLGALDTLGVSVPSKVLDAGASTGGFTQVVLARGAELVHAVDVGHDQISPVLRDDPRVIVHEGLNLRDLLPADLAVDGVVEPVDLVVGDVSFISLTMILEPISSVVSPDGLMLLLVKPQFEVGRKALRAHGVVTDPTLRTQAVAEVMSTAISLGWRMCDECDSPLPGQDGNIEHFILLERMGR